MTVQSPSSEHSMRIGRRDFLRLGAVGAASAILGVSPLSAARAAAASRPSIVLIMADDMGYSDIGCYGSEIKTPTLDRLAAGGVRFTQFYNAARCCPTRASLMTGLYPHQAGVGQMVSDLGQSGYIGRLNDRSVTIPEVLRQAGYQTFMSGKWHLTPFDYEASHASLHRDTWPLQRGFDRFFGTLAGAGSHYSPVSLMRDNEFITPEGDDFYYTDAISNEAARYIQEADQNKPLFLYLAYTAPHWPLHARERDIAKYADTYTVGWDAIRKARHKRMIELGIIKPEWPLSERNERVPSWDDADHKDWEARRMAVHAAMVDAMDQGIGRIVDTLKKTDRFENTLIFFLSDNGGADELIRPLKRQQPADYYTETRHGHFARGGTRPDVMPGPADTYASFGPQWANAANTPFRLFKKWCHEGGVASPLIAHWPAGIKTRGELRHDVGHLIDIMATCIDAADAAYPAERKGIAVTPCEGVSLLPAFAGKGPKRKAIFFEHEGHRAVRIGKWKLVAEYRGPWELYDMEADRTEINNLIDERPDLAGLLEALYEQWAKRAGVLPWPVKKDQALLQ